MIDRRAFLRGLIAAPAVVAAAHIMPVRSIKRLIVPRGITIDAILRAKRALEQGSIPPWNGRYVAFVHPSQVDRAREWFGTAADVQPQHLLPTDALVSLRRAKVGVVPRNFHLETA